MIKFLTLNYGDMKEIFTVRCQEGDEIVLRGEDVMDFDIQILGDQEFHVIYNHINYRISVMEIDFQKKRYQLKVNNYFFDLSLEDSMDRLVSEVISSGSSSKKHSDIKAPMPGLVLEIAVVEGQNVKEGDKLLVLEAMKMENILKSPTDGIVKVISVSEGNSVDKGQILLEIN